MAPPGARVLFALSGYSATVSSSMGRLIEATMRDFLDDAPIRVTVEHLTPDGGHWMRLTRELVALTAGVDAVFLGGARGQKPTQRKTVPVEDIYTLAF